VSSPFLGQILTVPYNFAPRNWSFCNGQLLPINQNTALFSLLGTFYGGNGTSNFALPNLQGRVPVHVGGSSGQGPGGLSSHVLGESDGEETHTLSVNEIPSHSHTVSPQASNDERTTDQPGNAYPTTGGVYASTHNSNAPMGAQSTSQVGGQPHDNRQPYLVLNYVIAMSGIFPSRS
jgi:microcystin-dependent protein